MLMSQGSMDHLDCVYGCSQHHASPHNMLFQFYAKFWSIDLIGWLVFNSGEREREREFCTSSYLSTVSWCVTKKIAHFTHSQWSTAYEGIKDPSVENPELGAGQYIAMHVNPTAKDFFLLFSTLLVHSPAFFPKPLPSFACVSYGWRWFLWDFRIKYFTLLIVIDNWCKFCCWVPTGFKTTVTVFLGLCSEIVNVIWVAVSEKETCGIMTCRMND